MNFTDIFANLWKSTGIFNMILPADPNLSGAEQIMHMYGAPIMFLVCLVLLYPGIKKEFEPLLLVPIAFGGILAIIFTSTIGFAPISYEWYYFIGALVISVLISTLAGLYPASKAAKLDPVESLRHE